MDRASPSPEEKVTLAISPVKRAQDAFALAKYLSRRSRWPHFHITHVANNAAIVITTREGWAQLREALESDCEEVLSIASVEGNHIDLRVASTCTLRIITDTGPAGPEEDRN